MVRHCGTCTLCCRLLPMRKNRDTKYVVTAVAMGMISPQESMAVVPDFDKLSGERCQYQRSKGCSVYARRPFGCRVWNCRWLTNDDTNAMARPDRVGYVVD